MLVLAVSTVLNVLYFLRTVIRIYTRPKETAAAPAKAGIQPDFLIPGSVLTFLNLFLGLAPFITTGLLEKGLHMFT